MSAPALPDVVEAPAALSDRGALALAAGAAAGAWWHRPVPLVLGLLVAALAVAVRRPWLLVVAAALLAAELGERAHAGLEPPSARPVAEVLTLVADPRRTRFGARVDARLDGRRVQLEASGAAAGALEASLAGEQVAVRGRLRAPSGPAPWLVPRHVSGIVRVDHLERAGAGAAPWRAANRVRRLLDRGAESLGRPADALFAGFVLGDDRGQPPEIVDDFRGSGLTHVLVVSGQNLALVLATAGPALRRMTWPGRWATTGALIAAFAVVTRAEPSVLRASAMAAVAVTAAAVGRPAAALRTLGLGAAALILVDPLLVHSIGFQLSVGASLALALLAAPVAARLPGPRPLAELLAATAVAQLGVAPVLVGRFGGMPVATLLANPLAVPVSGLVTAWGLPAGLVAGALGGRTAELLHLPTRLAIWWVAEVARRSAALPLGELRALHVVALAVLGAVWFGLRRPPAARWTTPAGAVIAAAALLVVAAPARALASPPRVQVVQGGGEVVRGGAGTTVRFSARASPATVLEALRRAGVRGIDVLEVDAPPPPELLRALAHRWPPRSVVVRR